MDVKLGLIQKQYTLYTTKLTLLICDGCYRGMLRISWTSHTTKNIDVLQKIGVKETTMINNLKTDSCLMHNEKHIRALRYYAENNRRKSGSQTRKRDTKTNMGRRSKRLDWLEMM